MAGELFNMTMRLVYDFTTQEFTATGKATDQPINNTVGIKGMVVTPREMRYNATTGVAWSGVASYGGAYRSHLCRP